MKGDLVLERENEMITEIERIVKGTGTVDEKLLEICTLLDSEVERYNWTGFYLVDPEKEKMLVLGPYVGEPTEHVHIPFGDGICGHAAATGKLSLIDDVSKEDNYLSCSPDVRSEMVIPIYKDDRIVGELDIDSHDLSAFSTRDSIFLQKICDIVADIL